MKKKDKTAKKLGTVSEYSSMEKQVLKALMKTFSVNMLVNGTETKSMVKGNVLIKMDQNIKDILIWTSSMAMGNFSGPQMKMHWSMSMRVIGKKVKWMEAVSSEMLMGSH